MSTSMSKPIYIGITQNPPKIVSIGETIDGMKMVDILLDNENMEDITSQLQFEFDELLKKEAQETGTEAPIEQASPIEESEPEVIVDAPTVDESPSEEARTDVLSLTTSPLIGAGLKPKKHKITKRYKNRLLKRRKTKRIHT
jgi:hypothetical protein